MRDAEPGEALILLNHARQPAPTPHRATHAILVREGATEVCDRMGEGPEVMRVCPLSLRAHDGAGWMLDAGVVEGRDVEPVIEQHLANPAVSCRHTHDAQRGCHAGRIGWA